MQHKCYSTLTSHFLRNNDRSWKLRNGLCHFLCANNNVDHVVLYYKHMYFEGGNPGCEWQLTPYLLFKEKLQKIRQTLYLICEIKMIIIVIIIVSPNSLCHCTGQMIKEICSKVNCEVQYKSQILMPN